MITLFVTDFKLIIIENYQILDSILQNQYLTKKNWE